MRRFVLLGLAAFGLLVPGVLAAPPSGGLLVVGHATVPSTFDVSLEVTAVSSPGDGVHGRYVVAAGGQTNVIRVECMVAFDDYALVGGHISWSSNPIVIGHTGMIAVRDLPAGDSVAILFSSSGLDTCPNVVSGSWWLSLSSGDFGVHHVGPPQ